MKRENARSGSLPYKFRSFLIELGAAVTPGGNGIVIHRGFKAIALT
jgi:hypothetical protein